MKVVGITGGIGSGKTTVCKIFKALGIPVFYADDEAKKLYDDPKIISAVIREFGMKILNSKKKVNKKKLARIIFNDNKALAKINAIIHPATIRRFEAWKKKQKEANYVIKEAAIMIESGTHQNVDFLISINANNSLRMRRIMKRDGAKPHEVKMRMKNQLSDKERNKYADAIIVNDGNHSLIEQIMQIHNLILKR
jgi:dephospho-CoA kinase